MTGPRRRLLTAALLSAAAALTGCGDSWKVCRMGALDRPVDARRMRELTTGAAQTFPVAFTATQRGRLSLRGENLPVTGMLQVDDGTITLAILGDFTKTILALRQGPTGEATVLAAVPDLPARQMAQRAARDARILFNRDLFPRLLTPTGMPPTGSVLLSQAFYDAQGRIIFLLAGDRDSEGFDCRRLVFDPAGRLTSLDDYNRGRCVYSVRWTAWGPMPGADGDDVPTAAVVEDRRVGYRLELELVELAPL